MDPKEFDELIEGGKTEAPEEESRALFALAKKLTEMSDPSALSDQASDRIFAMVNAKLEAEASPAPARSRVKELAAHLPRPLIQRQADALAMAIDQVRSGHIPALAGDMALMASAAAALRPLPNIKPSPSFVDWLEVRLMSPKLEMGSERSGRAWLSGAAANLNAVFQSGRVQAGMAGAAAVMAAVALLSLNISEDPSGATKPAPQTVASPGLTETPSLDEPDVPAPTQVAKATPVAGAKSPVARPQGDPGTKGPGVSPPQGPGNPGEPPAQSDEMAAATGGGVRETTEWLLGRIPVE